LKGVSIFIQGADPAGGLGFTRRIEAGEALLIPGYWVLANVSEARPGSETLKSETLRLPTSLDEGSAVQKRAPPGAVGFWDLPAAARAATTDGYPAAGYRLHLQQLLATPLLLAAMTLLAATCSLRLFRLGDLALLAGSGVALGFAFFFFNQICGALGLTDVIPVELAAWCPPTLVLLSGLTLLFYTEDG
jgi:lipopolysaccharide export system permease protein